MNLAFNHLTRAHTLYFYLIVVGIHLGLTSELRQRVHAVSELRQRVHAVSELTPEERDCCLLVTGESLIDSSLSQVSSGELPSLLIEAELAYSELV